MPAHWIIRQDSSHMLSQRIERPPHVQRSIRQPDPHAAPRCVGANHFTPSIARTNSAICGTGIAGNVSSAPQRNRNVITWPTREGATTTSANFGAATERRRFAGDLGESPNLARHQ
jgi:hypothetical protein